MHLVHFQFTTYIYDLPEYQNPRIKALRPPDPIYPPRSPRPPDPYTPSCRVMATREIAPLLQKVREVLLGRKHANNLR